MISPRRGPSIWLQMAEAGRRLRSGEPVAVPTETVYGLAAPIDNPAAIERVFQLKERPFFDPLIVHLAEMAQVQSVMTGLSPFGRRLAEAFWPGPLTLIGPRLSSLNPMICSGLENVAVRVPAHPVIRRIIRTIGVPLAAPSANRFGRTSPTTAGHVRAEWPAGEVFVVDAGPSAVGIESTVLSVEEHDGLVNVTIHRPGMITDQMILALSESAIPEASGRRARVTVRHASSEASPGHLPFHYQPAIPLLIVSSDRFPLSSTDVLRAARELGAATETFASIELPADPAIAARELYATLRRLADSGVGFLIAAKPPAIVDSRWAAIWDRLDRAASLHWTD